MKYFNYCVFFVSHYICVEWIATLCEYNSTNSCPTLLNLIYSNWDILLLLFIISRTTITK